MAFVHIYVKSWVLPLLEEKLATEFDSVFANDEKPDLVALYNDADFAFFNSHPIFDDVRPTTPNSVRIGGPHLRQGIADKLPGEVRTFLEGADHGVIYISFGTVRRMGQTCRLNPWQNLITS